MLSLATPKSKKECSRPLRPVSLLAASERIAKEASGYQMPLMIQRQVGGRFWGRVAGEGRCWSSFSETSRFVRLGYASFF